MLLVCLLAERVVLVILVGCLSQNSSTPQWQPSQNMDMCSKLSVRTPTSATFKVRTCQRDAPLPRQRLLGMAGIRGVPGPRDILKMRNTFTDS